jgi:AhpD family alkylhydroperoxidase
MARMRNPVLVIPEAMQALQTLGRTAEKGGVPAETLGLVQLRASQINGCSVCVDMHGTQLAKEGVSAQRALAVSAWRHSPYFSDAERAALALAEAVTRLADVPDPVPAEIWDEAARYYDEPGLAALLIAVGTINVWNRFNVAVGQMAGEWKG